MLADGFSSSHLPSQCDRTSWEHPPKTLQSGAWEEVLDRQFQLHFAAEAWLTKLRAKLIPAALHFQLSGEA